MTPEAHAQHRSGSLYGAFAFGSIVLTCFGGYFFNQRFFGPPEMVPVTFALGAIYVALGVLSNDFLLCGGKRTPFLLYYLAQGALLTAMVFLSPSRGFFGMIVLPLVSQGIFDLRTRNAVLNGVYLMGANVAVWWIDFGWGAAIEAIYNYSAGFAFTIAFTLITKRALNSREREEKLRLEIESAHEQLKVYAATAEDLATTRERNRVAREIHDGVGHYLTVVKTQLDAAAALIPTQPDRARDAVVKAAKLTGEALDDVRRSVGALRTDTTRPPLPAALKQLATLGEPVPALAVEGTPRPLPPAVEHALYRAAQEGLTNIRKHARATTSLLRLDFREPQRVRLELADNGVGANGTNGTGYGLTGLRERIELLGGTVESGNRAAGGFALTVEVPA
ncbi:MAG TPA: sensor histidine kinase [Lacunisphaera sp.]|jgi:signal transduction histidine kinase|nr:sensor histidine kinase [Lacunisphaera sp.]HQY06481.1 sensor histidine kinase [Lacunisphaera sp.]